MIEALLNTPFQTVVCDLTGQPLTDARLYIGSTQVSGNPIIANRIGNTSCWSVSFTPVTTGVYSLHAFGTIQLRVRAVSKSLYTAIANIEDEALGSWNWNKTTGVLTLLRQDGNTLASFLAKDELLSSSRELIS